MAYGDSVLDVAEDPRRSAKGLFHHDPDSLALNALALMVLLVAVFFLLQQNLLGFGLAFLAFAFLFHPGHQRRTQRTSPMMQSILVP